MNILRSRLHSLSCVACLGLLCGCGRPPEQSGGKPVSQVRVHLVQKAMISTEIPVVGTVVPVEISRVASGAAGNVVEFPLREGAYVEAGQEMAKLRDVTLKIEIAHARALAREKAQQYDEVVSGYRPEEIAQVEARMKAAAAANKFAQAALKRTMMLHEKGVGSVTLEQLEEAQALADESEQTHAEAAANYNLMMAGNRIEAIEAAKAAKEAQEQDVKRLEDELAKRTITAPFSGYIVQKHIDVGEWVEMGGMIATLAKLDEVEIIVNVEESSIHDVKVDQAVDVFVRAASPEPFSGAARYIVPKAQWEQGSRSFPVIIRVRNRIVDGHPQLKEGMTANVTFRGEPREAILVPKDAVVRSSGRPTVFVVEDGNRVRAEVVSEGITSGEFIEVFGNIQEGDVVVTEGVERLRPFETVAILDPPADANRTAVGQSTSPDPTTGTAQQHEASGGL